LAEFAAAPVLLMMWEMVPTPPSETTAMSWNFTPATAGTSNEWAEATELLTLKKQ
jgi:hypothetical protein